MRKRGIAVTVLLIFVLVLTFAATSLFYNAPIDISGYSSKYKKVYEEYIKVGTMLSDAAVIAEYTDVYNDMYLIFNPVEVLYGDVQDEEFYILIWSAEKEALMYQSYTVEDGYGISDPDLSQYSPYTIGGYHRKLYQEDLTKGEKYLILLRKYPENGWQHDRYDIPLGVIASVDYPFSEKNLENPEIYTSAYDYIKYIEKTIGYGYTDSEVHEMGMLPFD